MIDSREETEILKNAQSGDYEAREKMILENAGLVRSIAKRFSGRGCDMEDIIQLGNMGLFKAMENFDFSYGVKFSTYAVPLITGEIKRFLRDNGAIKVSRAVKELSVKIEMISKEYEMKNGSSPSVGKLAEILGETSENIVFAISSREPVSSLEEIASDGEGRSLIERIADENAKGEDEITDEILLERLIATLPERDQIIIKARYFEGKTQSETAGMLGISQVQVSRAEKRALRVLREKCINL